MPHGRCRQLGFTIVELLVTISIIGVLLSIILPALSGAKKSAMELAALAHQREVGALVRQYGFDRHDQFPFFGTPGTDEARLCLAPDDPFAQMAPVDDSQQHCMGLDYWDQPMYWAKHMRFLGYDTTFAAYPPELQIRNDGQPVVLATVDWLTLGAYAPPNFWREGDPQLTQDQNVQRWASVEFPSNKVILQRPNFVRDLDSTSAAGPVLSWFSDGHAERLRQIDMLEAVTLRQHYFSPEPGLTTLGGLAGRDR